MYEKQAAPALVMVALLLFAAATPRAYGQASLLGININSQVCSSSTGNCNGTTPGLSEVLVKVTCSTSLLGTSVTVGQGVTGINRALNITAPNLLNTVGATMTNLLSGGQLPCLATITLPLNQVVCPTLNTLNGIIVGVPVLAKSLLTPVLGTLANVSIVWYGSVTV